MIKLIILSYSYKSRERMSAYFLTHISHRIYPKKDVFYYFFPSEKPYIPRV